MPFCGNDEVLDEPHRPSSDGHSCFPTRSHPPIRRWIEAQGATEKALVRRVELRGLEPLTPTLPGRHDRVRRSPPPIVTTVWAAISSHLETAANGGGHLRIHRNCNQNCNQSDPVGQRRRAFVVSS